MTNEILGHESIDDISYKPESKKEKIHDKIARENFEKWNEALKSKDPDKVAELYSDEATFLATVSGKFRKEKADAKEYFVHFLENNPEGEIKEEEVTDLGADSYMHTGMYDFRVGPEEDRKTVEARFTFIWRKNKGGKWEILHHHSSKVPVEESTSQESGS
jgi:uncharacterized protein (TIGR02246 family)